MKKKSLYPYIFFFCCCTVAQAQPAYSKKPFPSVQIGDQLWMTVNWDYPMPKSFYYDNDSAGTAAYGKLYYYSNALAAAPPGWHLPTLDEWMELIDTLGGLSRAAEPMFAECDTCLHLLAGGYKSANISADNSDLYGFLDKYAFYWTATPDGEQTAYAIHITKATGEFEITPFRRANGFSVRYIKDR